MFDDNDDDNICEVAIDFNLFDEFLHAFNANLANHPQKLDNIKLQQ